MVELKELKKEYNKFCEKYSLPSFEELDNAFEVSCVEHKEFLLREARRKIAERLEIVAKFLEELLQPDQTLANLHECRKITEDDKKRIFDLYRKLMMLCRYSFELDLVCSEEKDASFIKDVFKEWKELKNEILDYVKKAEESWKDVEFTEEELEYLG